MWCAGKVQVPGSHQDDKYQDPRTEGTGALAHRQTEEIKFDCPTVPTLLRALQTSEACRRPATRGRRTCSEVAQAEAPGRGPGAARAEAGGGRMLEAPGEAAPLDLRAR